MPRRKEGSHDGLTGHRRRRCPRPRAPRERDAVRGHQDRLLLARIGAGPLRDHRDRDRRDSLPRRVHLLPQGRAARARGRIAALRAPRWAARVGHRRGADRLGRAHAQARVHPRAGDAGPAHEVRAGARGGALPVDGRRAPAVPLRGGDRCGGAAHRGAARVRRRRPQVPRPHRLARGGRDRERPAIRGDAPARRRPHDAHATEPGARRRDAARGPARRGHARRARAARRGHLPDLAARRRGRRARAGRGRPTRAGREHATPGPGGAPARHGSSRRRVKHQPTASGCSPRRSRRATSSSASSAAA